MNQTWRGDGWLSSERRRTSSDLTSRIRRKLSISLFNNGHGNSSNDSSGDTAVAHGDGDEIQDNPFPAASTNVPGAYAIAGDDASLHSSSDDRSHDCNSPARECTIMSSFSDLNRTMEDETELTLGVGHFDEPSSKFWDPNGKSNMTLFALVVLAVAVLLVAGGAAAFVLFPRPKEAANPVIVAPPDVSAVCDSSTLDPFLQCQCLGRVQDLGDSVRTIRQALIRAEFRDHVTTDLDVDSCDPVNIALVWLSMELSNRVMPLEVAVNRFVLVLLYASMEGKRWKIQEGWLSDTNECNWHGIGCDELRKIISIKLADNQVGGKLSAELGMLSNLRIIDFSDNEISGSIPSEMLTISTLEHFSVFSNAITGAVPDFSGLRDLKELNLGRTLVSGAFPLDGLAGLSGLEVLNLHDASFRNAGLLLTVAASLPNLRILELSRNAVARSIPESIGNLVQLEHLVLIDCDLSGSIPASIGNLKNLRTLSFRRNFITGSIPTQLGAMTGLRLLDVSENPALAGTIPSELAECTELENFYMDMTKISGILPLEFGTLTSLAKLDVSCNSRIRKSDSFDALCDVGTTIYTSPEQSGFGGCSCCTRDRVISLCDGEK